jgi:sec-independent protein translocase protein TatB
MFNLDPAKLLVIAIVGIILLGPDKLPNVAKQAGAAWRSFNEFRHRMESEVRNTVPDLPPTSEIARLARSPSALLHHLSTLSPDEDADEAPDGSFQPPDGAVSAAGAAPVGEAAPASADGAGVPADGAGPPTDGVAASGVTTRPPAGDVEPTPSPAPNTSVTPSPSPEVIAPADPTLN